MVLNYKWRLQNSSGGMFRLVIPKIYHLKSEITYHQKEKREITIAIEVI